MANNQLPTDPISVVQAFNDCINNQDIDGLAALMSKDHTFIDRDGSSHGPKSHMMEGWKEFFKMFPAYKNTFNKFRPPDSAPGDQLITPFISQTENVVN